MCRPSALVLYTASAVLFLLGGALVALPFVARCSFSTKYCKALGTMELADQSLYGLYATGAALLVFALVGCCLAASGKKRFRWPCTLVMLAMFLAVSAATVWQADTGAALAKLHTFEPGKLDQAVADLKSKLMRDLFHDFSAIYTGGECTLHGAELECPECGVLQTALDKCQREWQPSADAQLFLQNCTKQLGGEEAKCDGDCTQVFCKCAGTLQDDLERNEQYVLYGLGGLAALLFVVLTAACCVQRKPERAELVQPILLEPSAPPQAPLPLA